MGECRQCRSPFMAFSAGRQEPIWEELCVVRPPAAYTWVSELAKRCPSSPQEITSMGQVEELGFHSQMHCHQRTPQHCDVRTSQCIICIM